MKLLIKFPTRSRPEKFFNVLDCYYKNLKTENYEFVISCDVDDDTMNNEAVKHKLDSYPKLKYFFERNKSKIEAVNNNMQNVEFDIVLLASDDMVPVCYGYDEIIIESMVNNFPDTDGVLWFNDGFQGSRLNTLCILGKKYYDRFGYIYHPSYNSLYCDTEFTIVSQQIGLVKYFDQPIIKHQQYSIVGEAPDELYLKNDDLQTRDKAVFESRSKENFPCLLKTFTHKFYIFVHDVKLIEFLEAKKKFASLKNYTYVLLTANEFDTSKFSNVIVAKNCKQHIESFNNYLQFTGWFCLVANKLINTDYVTLLEYDVNIEDNALELINQEILKDQLKCYGYARLPKTNSFLNNDVFSEGLVSFCKTHGIDPSKIISSKLSSDWIVTSNITFNSKTFAELVKSNLFIKFLNYLKNNKYSGHWLERFTTLFLTLNNIPYRCIEQNNKGIITHLAIDSHNTQGRHGLYKQYQKLL